MSVARTAVGIVATGISLALPGPGAVQEATEVTHITHVQDSDSDRTPSVTAVPQYPMLARRDRVEGEATVCYTISARGQITRPSIRRSSHRIFEKPVMKAIRQSSYEPLPPDQRPSKVKSCRTFRFLLSPVAIEEVE